MPQYRKPQTYNPPPNTPKSGKSGKSVHVRMFYLLYCYKCCESKLPKFPQIFPSLLPSETTHKDILDAWNQLIVADKSIDMEVDICETLIPNEPSVIASPNSTVEDS